MKILVVASEAAPFVKTGGLADVAGALPKALFQRGHDVRLVVPRYGDIDTRKYRLFPLMPEIKVRYGHRTIHGSVLRCSYPRTEMPVYFLDEPLFSLRRGIYGNAAGDFTDNDVRFAFFAMATLWLLKGLDWCPDVIHVNDWQTGLIPVLLRHHPEVCHDPFYRHIRTVFSVHNLAFQGNFDKFVLPNIGLPWDVYHTDGMEFYAKASFLKGGLMFSDQVVAVSPTYAAEIQTEEYGAGMDGSLQKRAGVLSGILNGIDTEEWNPATDEHLAATFSIDNLAGRAACKADLQTAVGLPADPDVPIVGMTTRLSLQKGLDILAPAMDRLAELNAQFVFLGAGDREFEAALLEATNRHGERIAAVLGYDNPLSHKIVAGSDIFIVPSRFEPCGLTQMYAMRYGSVPYARSTGGLRDTVVPVTPEGLLDGNSTGFLFDEYSTDAFLQGLVETLEFRRKRPDDWRRLQQNGMRRDWSWDVAAEQYEKVYTAAAAPEAPPLVVDPQ